VGRRGCGKQRFSRTSSQGASRSTVAKSANSNCVILQLANNLKLGQIACLPTLPLTGESPKRGNLWLRTSALAPIAGALPRIHATLINKTNSCCAREPRRSIDKKREERLGRQSSMNAGNEAVLKAARLSLHTSGARVLNSLIPFLAIAAVIGGGVLLLAIPYNGFFWDHAGQALTGVVLASAGLTYFWKHRRFYP